MKLEKFIATIVSRFTKNRGKKFEEEAAFVKTDDGEFIQLVFGRGNYYSVYEGDEVMVSAHVEGREWTKPNGEVVSIMSIVVDDCVPLHCDEESVSWAIKTLGVSAGCSQEEAKRAYKDIIMKVHPDRFSAIETSQQFKDELNRIAGNVNRAYSIIKQINK